MGNLSTKAKNTIQDIAKKILACSDAKYISEIFVIDGSITNGELGSHVSFMVETDPGFTNTDLYETIDAIWEDNNEYPFRLYIAVEPDGTDRSHGSLIVYKRK